MDSKEHDQQGASSTSPASDYNSTTQQRIQNLKRALLRCQLDPPVSTSQPYVSMDSDFKQAYTFLRCGQTVSPVTMTIPSEHNNQQLDISGNLLISLSRDILKRSSQLLIDSPDQKARPKTAVASRKVTIEAAKDWVVLEGIFDNFSKRPARSLEECGAFYGVVTIPLNQAPGLSSATTVQFKHKISSKRVNGKWVKKDTGMLYAHLHDQQLLSHLRSVFGMNKYYYPDNFGLSYIDMVNIVERFKLQSSFSSDSAVAQRQLALLAGPLYEHSESPPLDRFLAFFNSVLFGAEASRNSLSFLSATLILKLIVENTLTYSTAFRTPTEAESSKDGHQLAANPMSSPFAGSGNFLHYMDLLKFTDQEYVAKVQGSFSTDMRLSLEYPFWSQIQIKEALLIRYWLSACGLFKGHTHEKQAVRISIAIQRHMSGILADHLQLPELSPIPQDYYTEVVSLFHPKAFKLGLTGGRFKHIDEEFSRLTGDLQLGYLTPREVWAFESGADKTEKLISDARFEMGSDYEESDEDIGEDEEQDRLADQFFEHLAVSHS